MLRITALMDNKPSENKALIAEHGLSLLAQYQGRRILFDCGSGANTLINAHRLGIDLKNLDAVVHSGKRYALRVPLIPGFAAQPDMAREMVQFAAARGIRRVHLLPYNPLAVSKYTQLGKTWPFPSGFTESALLTELLDIWRSRIPDTELKN